MHGRGSLRAYAVKEMHMAQDDIRVFVIGFGEPGAGDDAAGLHVMAALERMSGLGCELRSVRGNCPSGLLADIPGDALVICIDSLDSVSSAGAIHCVKLPSSSGRARHLNPKSSIDLQSEIEDAKKRFGRVPRLFLIGIEVVSGRTSGELSEEARKAVDEIVRNFSRYLKLARDLAL